MYDELVKMLRTCSERDSCVGWEESCPYLGTGVCNNKVEKAADAIEKLCGLCASQSKDCSEAVAKYLELWAKQPRWIPVTERLPDAGERVLCYCRANIYEVMKMRTDGDWVCDTNHVYMHSFVTHWMPLPEPPKGQRRASDENNKR